MGGGEGSIPREWRPASLPDGRGVVVDEGCMCVARPFVPLVSASRFRLDLGLALLVIHLPHSTYPASSSPLVADVVLPFNLRLPPSRYPHPPKSP
jgi:hypothetical protein